MTFFRPIVSVSFPEKGLDIAADIVKRVMTRPFLSEPPRLVMKSFSSGNIKLKLVMKKNMENVNNQKFFPYLNVIM